MSNNIHSSQLLFFVKWILFCDFKMALYPGKLSSHSSPPSNRPTKSSLTHKLWSKETNVSYRKRRSEARRVHLVWYKAGNTKTTWRHTLIKASCLSIHASRCLSVFSRWGGRLTETQREKRQGEKQSQLVIREGLMWWTAMLILSC
jgi:hypothetical protein